MMTEISQQAVEYVCLNLRESDRREVFGLCPHDNPVRLGYEVAAILSHNARGRVLWHEGVPAAVIGFSEWRPGVWQAVLIATDEWPNVADGALRWFRSTAQELRDKLGAHRVHVDSHEEHWTAHKFLRRLGAVQEGPPMRGYGKDGSAYIRFVWLAHVNDQKAIIRRKPDNVLFTASSYHASDARNSEGRSAANSA